MAASAAHQVWAVNVSLVSVPGPSSAGTWAVTSTKDKAKGILIDVFDANGAYQDCFFLKLPEAAVRSLLSPGACALDREFFWVIERSEDETFAIKKYRIEGRP